jgi:endonuclease
MQRRASVVPKTHLLEPGMVEPSRHRRGDPCGTTRPVRLLIAWCSVEYEGRLGARLPPALRLVMLKADGSIAVHSDSGAYKPLNWMSPPCTIREGDGTLTARTPRGERLTIELHDIVSDQLVDLGDDPGLAKDGVEAELQQLIAARVGALRDDLRIVRREYPTAIGPVDLLCRDGDGRAVVIEVKRVGEIAGVEQLLRYQERLDGDTTLAPTRGVLVATRIKPQARVFAESRGVECIEVDLEELRAGAPIDPRLF